VVELCDKIKNQVLSERERATGLVSLNKVKFESSLIKLDSSNISKVYSPREVNQRYSPSRQKLNDA